MIVHWRIDQWFSFLPIEVRRDLKVFHQNLVKVNQTLNLLSMKTEGDADLIHFADCILGGQLILENTTQTEIYDFGSGNGLPGVVLAILDPRRTIHLIEVDGRKAEFLKFVAHEIGLKNVVVHKTPINKLKPDSVKAAVSRGFASLTKALMTTRALFPPGGVYFHFKGPEWVMEAASLPHQLCSMWNTRIVSEYTLPESDIKLGIVITERV